MFVQVINDNCLPSEYSNVICTTEEGLQKNKVLVRSSLKTMEDINLWVKAFGKNTNTQWNARSSCPLGTKIVCSKKFVCHHSAFMKVPTEANKKGLSKNANCHASILIVIKLDTVNTRKKDPFMKGLNRLQAVITIDALHSHTLKTAETNRFLQASSETRDLFFEYFNDRMTISEAKKYHENLYEFEEDKELLLANGSKNPTYSTVQNWYHAWRLKNLGPRTGKGLLDKLKEKQAAYKENGTEVLFSAEPFAVAIVTPIMARGHAARFSDEVCFVDSTSACDPEQHSVTFVMTPCSAGAVPLGIIITKGQTYEAYSKGFQLLQDIVSNTFHPKIFVTDNSEAEILALKSVFPQSTTLLCIFHVLQAVWRWLWDSKHAIDKEHRQELMKSFRAILYSRTPADAEQAFFNCISNCSYENWIKYVQSQWNTKEKWCLAWRDESSRGHYTNNFCEVSIRLFKDNVLCRVKSYNVVALVDVISSVLEDFYKRKLREFANSRSSNARYYFLNIMLKTNYLEKSDIIYLDEDNYIVPSEKNKNIHYVVNVENGCCSCFQGLEGKFCKHQCAIYKFFEVKTQYFPPITTEDRYNIAKLALGEQAPPISFYEPFLLGNHSKTISSLHSDVPSSPNSCNNINSPCSFFDDNHVPTTSISPDETSTTTVEDICDIMKTCHKSFGSSSNGLRILNERLKAIKTEGQWESFIHTAGNSVPLRRRNATIKVQPTSISRRAAGVTRGSKRLPSGRKFKDEKVIKKRKRSLALNIKFNQPNATSHGYNH